MKDDWDAGRYAADARFVAELGAPLIGLLAPRSGERILDLGCGDGALTKKIRELGCDVVGVDQSPDMIRKAKEAGLDAREMDGHALVFDAEFDAVFSNAALHWMKRDPDAVLAGAFRALKPGGRFVAEMGGHGNVAAITVALYAALARRGIRGIDVNPWYFPTAAAYRARLEKNGFIVDQIHHFARPTPVEAGVGAWLDIFAGIFIKLIPDA